MGNSKSAAEGGAVGCNAGIYSADALQGCSRKAEARLHLVNDAQEASQRAPEQVPLNYQAATPSRLHSQAQQDITHINTSEGGAHRMEHPVVPPALQSRSLRQVDVEAAMVSL